MSDSDTSTSSDEDIVRGMTRNDNNPQLVTEQDKSDVRRKISKGLVPGQKSGLITDNSTDQHFGLFANMDKANEQLQPVTRPSRTQISGLPPITEASNENTGENKRYESDSSYDTDSDDDRVLPGVNPPHNPTHTATTGPSYGSGNVVPKDTSSPSESKEDFMLKKLDMLRKLGELTQYGVKLSQRYTMESDYNMMKYEYELHKSIRNKQNGIQYMAGGMVYAIKGVEMLNKEYNPFQFNLDGWSDHINNDITSYYDVLGELYEKYFSGPGENFPPEFRLMGMIAFSAASYHMMNNKMENLPSSDEVLSKDPALMEQLKRQNMEQLKKQKEALNAHGQKDHDEAIRKAKDLQYLQRAKEEYLRKQAGDVPTSAHVVTNAEKERKMRLQQLRQQLANRTNPPSTKNGMGGASVKMPSIPASMRAAGVTPPVMQQQLRQQQMQQQQLEQLQKMQQTKQFQNMQQMQKARQMQQMQQLKQLQEIQRQKQIAEQQKKMKEEDDDDVRSRASKISNEDIDKILGVRQGSTVDSSSVSTDGSSKVSIRSRRRKKSSKRKGSKKSRFSVDTR